MKIYLKKLNILFLILINIFLYNSVSFAAVSENDDSSKFVVSQDEKFNKIFREGRDLIDKEEWAKAAAKFNEIVCDCPEKSQVAAALYWLAFCYKKQKMFEKAGETLDRLAKNFPSSSWIDDARVMEIEIVPAASVRATERVRSTRSIAPTIGRGQSVSNASILLGEAVSIGSSKPQLDREDEIKLAAFQSLLSADPKRAIELLGEMLRSDSKASETLKRELVRILRKPRFLTAQVYDSYSAYESPGTKGKEQYLPQIRETLFKGYQSDSNVKVRTEIIYVLTNLNDEQSTNYVVRLYDSEENKELKKAIISSFGGAGNSHFVYAGEYLGTASNPTRTTGQSATPAAASQISTLRKITLEKLLEIVKNEKDIELRRLALSNVRRFSGWLEKEGTMETLSQMYDSESDEEFKISIIRSLASSKQKQATTKLLSIAKNDKSDKMRLEAIRSLSTSNDPEVLKFLEDLVN